MPRWELKASIAETGIQVPLLVRARNLSDGRVLAAGEPAYEVVAGERRYRAAQELVKEGNFDLETLPCLVRELSDAEARDSQIIENLQRAGVHPVEEAESYAAMIEQAAGWTVPAGKYFAAGSSFRDGDSLVAYVYHPRGGGSSRDPLASNIIETFSTGTKKENLKWAGDRAEELNAKPRDPEKLGIDLTAEDVAKRVGKPSAYVAQRLKLLTLGIDAKLLFSRNHLTLGHALLMARLTEADQGRALLWMLDVDPKYNKQPVTEVVRRRLANRTEEIDDMVDPGVCRYCQCTEDEACEGGCSWVNAEQTVCSNPECVEEMKAEAAEGSERPSVPNVAKYMHAEGRLIDATEAQLKRWIEANVLLKLADVPWRLDDDTLTPAGACMRCPKRSGSNAALFGDLTAEEDVCLDPACFAAKQDATMKRHKQAAKVTGASALLKISAKTSREKLEDGYEKKTIRAGQWLAAESGSCSAAAQGLMIDGPDKGKLLTVCALQTCKVHEHSVNSPGSHGARSGMSWEEARKIAQQKADAYEAAETPVRAAIYTAIRAKLKPDVDATLRHMLAKETTSWKAPAICELAGIKFASGKDEWKNREAAQKTLQVWLPKASREALLSLAFDCMHVKDVKVGDGMHNARKRDREKLWALAAQHGVDADAIAKTFEPQKEKPAAPSKSAKKTPAKKAVTKVKAKPVKKLSPEGRKRIADAMKKRWAARTKAAK